MTKQNSKVNPQDTSENSIPKFTIRQLLEAGVHFGHKTMRRNTKMSKYLFGVRNGISIIDLQKSGKLLNQSLKVAYQVAKNNGRILFVATKKQANDTIAKSAKRCGQYYVNHRWLGGMLTNWQTVSKSIKTLKDIEKQLVNDDLGLNKKEKLMLERKRLKLENILGGIKDMGGYPDLVFIIDTHRESLAIAEAKKIGIPIMAILDSNCNPDNITYPIPGNDDSIKSIKLYCHLLSEAILAGIRDNMTEAGVDVEKVQEKDSSDKKSESVKKESKEKEVKTASDDKKAEKATKAPVKKAASKKTATKTSAKKTATAKKSDATDTDSAKENKDK